MPEHRPIRHKPSRRTTSIAASAVIAAASAAGLVAYGPTPAHLHSAASSSRLDPSAEAARSQALARRLSQGVVTVPMHNIPPGAGWLLAAEAAGIVGRPGSISSAISLDAFSSHRLPAKRHKHVHQVVHTVSQKAASPPSSGSPVTAATGSPQQIAQGMLSSFGWSSSQFSCLDALWNRESGWNVHASNTTSGAYGIPQAVPGSKMASAGPDWESNAATQIRWGLTYIKSTYGSPCAAWSHSQATGWY